MRVRSNTQLALLAIAALPSALACNQSVLLGATGATTKQATVTKASGGTLEADADSAVELRGFKLVVRPNAVNQDQQLTLTLGSSDDPNSAGPSVVLSPQGLVFNPPAELTLPYSLVDGQYETELFVELEGGSAGLPQRIEHSQLTIDTSAHLIRCALPQLFEVHALAPHHCKPDSSCGSAGFCDDGFCHRRVQADGGLDPDYDGGPHDP